MKQISQASVAQQADRILSAPWGDWALERFPRRPRELLRAWDAADEFVLQHLQALPPVMSRVLIANDSFGALSVALSALQPLNWSDSWLAHQGMRANLVANGINEVQVRTLPSTRSPDFSPGLVIIKVPKTLALLEDQLTRLQPLLAADSRVLVAGMAKGMSTAVWQLLARIIGPTQTEPARKKAQLITVTVDSNLPATLNPYPTHWLHEGTGLRIVNHANVFSSQRLDIGTRFMLQHLQIDSRHNDIVDLGCGNGILGVTAGARFTDARVHFVDESYMAIESARQNFAQLNSLLPRAHFHLADGLSDFPSATVDLILCNPPFHENHAVGDSVALSMFQGAARALRAQGELWVVGNRHLGYHVKLKRWFPRVELVASNSKFVLFKASKNR